MVFVFFVAITFIGVLVFIAKTSGTRDSGHSWQKNEHFDELEPAMRCINHNEIEFAQTIASRFSPSRACGYSASFQHCWGRIQATCRPP